MNLRWIGSRCGLLIVAGALLAGCGLPPPEARTYDVAVAPPAPACTHAPHAVPWPKAFPHQFPLPQGAVVTSASVTRLGTESVSGFIPSHDFTHTAQVFRNYLPLAGFLVTKVTEYTDQNLRGVYAGHGYAGQFWVYPWTGTSCPGVMDFFITAAPGNTPVGEID